METIDDLGSPDGGLWISFNPSGLGFLKDGQLHIFTQSEGCRDPKSTRLRATSRDESGVALPTVSSCLMVRGGLR